MFYSCAVVDITVQGYHLVPSIDINECELEADNCHMNADCTDTIGSFECTCNSGFVGDGVNCTSMNFRTLMLCRGFETHVL